jgi:hypothetical protein
MPGTTSAVLVLTRMIHECLLRPAQVVSGGVLAPTLILNNSAELPAVKVGTTPCQKQL